MLKFEDSVLEVEGLYKLYSRSAEKMRRREVRAFYAALFRRPFVTDLNLEKGEFWSLADINFDLRRGEALGIIGLNGAGKTTLLRILAGQILPDRGEVRQFGRSASMIDLQAGFKNTATGRQNIYLRGAMLGRTREQVSDSIDEIIAFSELSDAIDSPFGSYSSGMKMRLAFSIMILVEPDILYIDEVLSVGDFRFRQKCLARIRDLRSRSAFVLVSHSMNDIKSFCSNVIVLHEGHVVFQGDPLEAIDVYENLKFDEFPSQEARKVETLAPQFHNENVVEDVEHYWCDSGGKKVEEIRNGEDLFFKIRFNSKIECKKLTIGVPVWTEEGVYVTGLTTEIENTVFSVKQGEAAEFTMRVPTVCLNPGVYISNVALTEGPEFLYRRTNPALRVLPVKGRRWGVVTLPHSWQRS